ncbi:MAG: DEAD/DEAH box helicase [Opitutaceae bacterium]|nr:DEAD/DEAH box helicase [Opitutaceae bacterium]
MLRLFLPPNLVTAAARDAIALKIELDASGAPPAALLPALALLQRWCGTDAPPPFVQITRAQLRQLIAALAPQPVFFRLGQPSAPLSWAGPRLRGVSEHLQEPPPSASATPDDATPASGIAAAATRPGLNRLKSNHAAPAILAAPAAPAALAALAVSTIPAVPAASGTAVPTTPPARRAVPPGASAVPPRPAPASAAAPMLVDGSEHYLAITLPSREHMAYADALALLKNSGFRLEPSNRKWWLRDRHKTLAFLAAHGATLRDTFQAKFTDNFKKNTARVSTAAVVCDITENAFATAATAAATAATTFAAGTASTPAANPTTAAASAAASTTSSAVATAYRVTLGLRAGNASENQLHAAALAGRAYIEDGGRVYLLPPAMLARLAAAQRALAGDALAGEGLVARRTHRVNAARLTDAESIIEEIAPDFKPPAAWRELSAALRDTTRLAPAPVPAALDARLRPYQRLGAAWLWHLRRHGLGGILADAMGLGKTLQALAVIAALKNENKAAGHLAPTSFDLTRLNSTCIEKNTAAASPASTSGPVSTNNPNNPANPASPGSPATSSTPAAPALVVCPASLVENWRREAARFAPTLRVFIHHGNHRLARASDLGAHDLVITSYGTLARDRALFAGAPLALLIADEAQHLKNRRSQNARALRSLRAGSRFLLTGTPLENSLDDLRSLLEILLPGCLDAMPPGARGEERRWHDERLRARAAPYILRRTKETVAPELPGKIEQILYCELAPAQAALYRRMRETTERRILDLHAGGASENTIRLATLTQLLRLRQVCCDPRLVVLRPNGEWKKEHEKMEHEKSENAATSAAADITSSTSSAATSATSAISATAAAADATPGASAPHSAFANPQSPFRKPHSPFRNPHSAIGDPHSAFHDPNSAFDNSSFDAADSAKLDTLLELLDEAIDDGHRILVFSQFTKLLDLAAAELDARGIAHLRLDGSMHVRARQAAVDRFDRDASIPVFLISLKAGGTGLNLAAADTVIHLDPWWNPSVEAQATDRAHRIGQTRVVTSYKLICSGTVEEKVLQLQDAKRKLLADVFEASDATAAKLTLADMKALLE